MNSCRMGLVSVLWLVAALAVAGCGAAAPTATGEGSGGFAVASTAKVNNRDAGLNVGDQAPDFVLLQADGNATKLSDLRGQPVVMNFWASWCVPCREEMPEIIRAYQAHQDQSLAVLGINAQESAEQARRFVDNLQIPFPVVLDIHGEVMQLYQVRGLPTTWFIDREGRIVARHAGLLTKPLLEKYLAEIF